MSEEAHPLVSIVVPSYNQGQYIEQTLISMLEQDYRDVEVIVVDAGSTDSTLSVLERYASRISYVSERDKGQSDAINKGFQRARGEVVTWLNSDDLYPDRRAISRMVAAFQDNPTVDILYGDFLEIDAAGRVLRVHERPGYSLTRLLRIGYISQPATFFRRRVIKAMPVREDLHYVMDLEYWLRADQLKFKFKHLPFVLAAERIHAEAKCVRGTDDMAMEARVIRQAYGAKFGGSFHLLRLFDRILLYALRWKALGTLFFYKRNPQFLTVPLVFEGAVARTLKFRL